MEVKVKHPATKYVERIILLHLSGCSNPWWLVEAECVGINKYLKTTQQQQIYTNDVHNLDFPPLYIPPPTPYNWDIISTVEALSYRSEIIKNETLHIQQ